MDPLSRAGRILQLAKEKVNCEKTSTKKDASEQLPTIAVNETILNELVQDMCFNNTSDLDIDLNAFDDSANFTSSTPTKQEKQWATANLQPASKVEAPKFNTTECSFDRTRQPSSFCHSPNRPENLGYDYEFVNTSQNSVLTDLQPALQEHHVINSTYSVCNEAPQSSSLNHSSKDPYDPCHGSPVVNHDAPCGFQELQSVSYQDQDLNTTYTVINEEPQHSIHSHPPLQSENQCHNSEKTRLRKRRRSPSTIQRDESAKRIKLQEKHPVLPGCDGNKCPKNCQTNFPTAIREQINTTFWVKSFKDQKHFIREMIKVMPTTTKKKEGSSRKTNYRMYRFRNLEGDYVSVCQAFFLNTLGQAASNDRMVRTAFQYVDINNQSNCSSNPTKAEIKDNRGSAANPHKTDHSAIVKDIEAYKPAIPHYRRMHAPNRRYISSELTVTDMHRRFTESGEGTCSYRLYLKIFSDMNISLTKLGNEECELCKEFDNHKTSCACDNICYWYGTYKNHHKRYTEARESYQLDAEQDFDNMNPVCSADLQKVLLLPMMDQYKRAIFTSRLVCFNETFAPVASKGKEPAAALLWHEATSGRKDEDIASAFYKFIMTKRDAHTITLWVDNCAAQNKNWTIVTMLSDLVNSDKISAHTICLKFFEPGHSFMSADSAHSQIETVLKRKKASIVDFEDLSAAVEEAGCKVIELNAESFYNFSSGLSDYKLKKAGSGRPYLSDIAQLQFKRGSRAMHYKNSHADPEFKTFDFLKKNYDSLTMVQKSKPRGVEKEKKVKIIQKLVPLMPQPKRIFWINLPESDKSKDLLNNHS